MAENELSELTRAELQAYYEFETLYIQRVPPPEKPFAAIAEQLGWEFWVMLIVAIATLLLNAMRTGSWFYRAAVAIPGIPENVNSTLGAVEAITAVIAYEGFLLMAGVSDGRKRKPNPYFKAVSIILVLVTSIVAGVGVSLNIVGDTVAWAEEMLKGLGILMGLASLLAFFSGEMLGSLYADAQMNVKGITDQYTRDLQSWDKNKLASWVSSRKKMIQRTGSQEYQENVRVESPEGRIVIAAEDNITRLVESYVRENNIDISGKGGTTVSGKAIATALSHRTGKHIDPGTVRVILMRMRERKGV
jgi:hypothetical protein